MTRAVSIVREWSTKQIDYGGAAVSQSALLSRSVSSGPKLYPRWSFDREALTTFSLVTLRSVRHTRRTA